MPTLQKVCTTISGSCDRLIKKEAMTEAQKKDLLANHDFHRYVEIQRL